MRHRGPAGYSLVELLAALTLVAVLAALAAPALAGEIAEIRVRSTLDRLTADIYRTRALAAVRATRLNLAFVPARGCAAAYVVLRREDGVRLDSVSLSDRGGVCLTSNASDAMSINSRGMLVGSPRTIRARLGDRADSITVSIAGRVYRW